MVQYTYQEKIAIMRILLDIVHADGIIDARESFFYNQLKDLFSLSDLDHNVVKTKNSLLALVQVKAMDDDKKKHFVDLMVKMIVVDEDVNVNEVAIYNVVCDFCDIQEPFDDKIDKDNKYTRS